MNRKERYALILCFLLLLTLCTGCAQQTPPETTGPSTGTEGAMNLEGTAPQSYPLPQENRKARSTSLWGVASTVSDGYFYGREYLRYYDAQSGRTMILCSQPGCPHNDSTCQAWLGNASMMVEYKGILYYVLSDDAGERLCAKDLSSGEITELDGWKHTEDFFYQCALGVCAYDHITVSLRKVPNDIRNPQGEEPDVTFLYDLKTGEKRELPREKEGESISVLAMNQEYALAQYARYVGDDPQSDVFYDDYALRLYRISDGSYTTVSTEEENGYHPTGDPSKTYGNVVVFQEKDTLCLYDLDKLEKRELLTMDNIINYLILDGKVFFITEEGPMGTPEQAVGVYYADLETGKPMRLENGGNTQVMEMGLGWEGDSFFAVTWKSGRYIIPKADFYLDNYEAAKPGGF